MKEYVFIKCVKCKEKIKIAKNTGAYWIEYPTNMPYFLLNHSDCGEENFKIIFE